MTTQLAERAEPAEPGTRRRDTPQRRAGRLEGKNVMVTGASSGVVPRGVDQGDVVMRAALLAEAQAEVASTQTPMPPSRSRGG
ncbi:MAG: hypothetical protein JNL21_24245 [Myxococcales bacterium]|nr:hypothetical protein [Myxococcales bacterium]